MKINSFSLEPSVPVANSQQGKAGAAASSSGSDVTQTAVQLLFDNQVKTVLNQLAKLLEQQAATLLELPADLANEAKQILQQPLTGEQVVAKGLFAMLQGQKMASQNLAAFANNLSDAANIKEEFPGGLPKTWDSLITKFSNQVIQLDPDIEKTILALAKELTDNPAPVADTSAVLQQAGRRLIDSLPREQYTLQSQDFQTKLPVLLNKLIENFGQEMTQLPIPLPLLEQEVLVSNLQHVCQQLLQELEQTASQSQTPAALQSQNPAKGQVQSFISLPSVIDDIISHFETQLIKLDITLEKDIIVANLRQVFRQLTQDLDSEDQAFLSNLVDELQESIPEKVRTAATLHNLPELKDIWVLQRMSVSRQWLDLPSSELRHAGQTLREMNTVVPRPLGQDPDPSPAKNSFNLTIPLYFGEEKKAYPAYIHIFQDREKAAGTTADIMPETWLRLCLSTENIGVVDMIFHIYGQNQLKIRMNFTDGNTADQFKTHIDDIRSKLDNSPLILSDFTVNPVQADATS